MDFFFCFHIFIFCIIVKKVATNDSALLAVADCPFHFDFLLALCKSKELINS
jgi:hypothetical protein